MNSIKYIIIIVGVLFLYSCSKGIITNMSSGSKAETNKYEKIIEEYLEQKRIEPTVTVNNISQERISFLDVELIWEHTPEGGLEFIINGNKVNTSKAVTLNDVWDTDKDSVNFVNYLQQVKYYNFGEYELLGLLLTSSPCTGLGCGVNYQLIYDITNKKTNYFGRFGTGYDLDLYRFSNSDEVDYLSKTFHGRNEMLVDTTEFVIYRRQDNGQFKLVRNSRGNKYYFRHIYSWETDTIPDRFEEDWIEKINNSR
ncbi:hypothetical protein I2I11_10230 [Pontibacter sp. 172403-2]|uniref:hypothetical protein n=1 Tax=Pontibacter rufus TaxID=2791028 RepID=UPI0018AFF860|nr:hypothetical protein [Pontibacter sp. 172403-2]MBF9253670.1 hypothetical protein [Pontibacter sp. 172403-2]